MKFSGKGPAIHDVLAGTLGAGGDQYRIFNDMAAEWPWPEDSVHVPKVGQFCSSCENLFKAGEMVYKTIETNDWVCWRHMLGLTAPVVQPSGE